MLRLFELDADQWINDNMSTKLKFKGLRIGFDDEQDAIMFLMRFK